jgi:hypothetical protein
MRKKMKTKQQKKDTFWSFLKLREHKIALCAIGAAYLAIGVFTALCYPMPSGIPDSEMYVLSAMNDTVNAWRPMGYSYYLQMLHAISSSYPLLFWVSFWLNALACVLFVFSAKYLLKLRGGIAFYVFAGLIVGCPSLLFCTNYLMSDGLFCSLTTLWLTTGMWLIHRPRNLLYAALHVALLVCAYATRYIGMAYTVVSVVVILLALLNGRKQVNPAYYALLLLPIVAVIVTNRNLKESYKKVHKVDELSPFSGWMWLNNISTMLPELRELDVAQIKGGREQELHKKLMQFPDSVYSTETMLNAGQMWDKNLPPKQYMYQLMEQQEVTVYITGWIRAGIIFQSYATQLVKKYPWKYFTHYLVPSFFSMFKYWDIETPQVFHSSNTDKYHNIQEKDYTKVNVIFPAINAARKVSHYIYWVLGTLCILFFIVSFMLPSRPSYAKPEQREKFLILILLLGFTVIYVGASVVACPNTAWRYSAPFYLPSILFMLVVLMDGVNVLIGKTKGIS